MFDAPSVSMLVVEFATVVTFAIDELSAGKKTRIIAVEIQLMSIPEQIQTFYREDRPRQRPVPYFRTYDRREFGNLSSE